MTSAQTHRRPGTAAVHGAASILALLLAAAALRAHADVQVLQLQDASIASTSPNTAANGQSGYGVADAFCVVNTTPGQGVTVQFVSAQGAAGNGTSWNARNSATGQVLPYLLSVSLASGASPQLVSASGGQSYVVPASAVAASVAACPAGGNVKKWITYTSALPTALYQDTVQVVVTPRP